MQELRLKHLLAIRWFHWINFPLLFLMIWSGLLIYWAYDVYRIGPFHFFPSWVYAALSMDHRLADGMALHFFAMWLFVINGVLYVGYLILSGEWNTWGKYNRTQRSAYAVIILMGAASVVSGLAIYKPVQFAPLTGLLGGYAAARAIHFALTMGFLLFFLVHVIQVARAGWTNFRSMVTGV